MILFRRYISKVVSQSVQLRLASNIGNRLPLYLLQYINKNSILLDKISKIARQLPQRLPSTDQQLLIQIQSINQPKSGKQCVTKRSLANRFYLPNAVSKVLSHGPIGQDMAQIAQATMQPSNLSTLHFLFQFDIRIFICKPTQGKVVFKEENRLIKAVFG